MALHGSPNASHKKSTVYVPSAYAIGGEETEIVTHITIPTEGGWGWVVVAASFICIFIVDGIVFTFGALFADMRDDLDEIESLVALINSVAFAVYFIVGPVASAIINRYGFRECAMIGSITCAISLLMSYFMKTYTMVLIFYGILTGVGASLINLSACLVPSFYFDRLRALALSISLSGSSCGCMIMYTVNSLLVDASGWRVATLIHSGMVALIFLLAMTFKPLSPVLVTQTTEEPAVVVTNLPKITDQKVSRGNMQRLFNTVSNAYFPTTADVFKQGIVTDAADKQTSTQKRIPKYTLSITGPEINARQLKNVQSVLKPGQSSAKAPNMEITIAIEPPKKRSFWSRLCQWQNQAPEARPMYRDDIFYNGKVSELAVYKKSVMNVDSKERFAIEYHMAVTRATAVDDIAERKYICSTAIRRVLVSMIDPSLLRTASFLMISFSAFFTYLGVLVPYIFLQERNRLAGMNPSYCSFIISFIGFASIGGRLILGALACKISPTKIYYVCSVIAGLAILALNFSFNVFYQFACAGIFGFSTSALVGLRCMVIVDTYGLEKLTNCTGLLYIFQGIGCLISTPMAMIIKDSFGYATSFNTAGAFLLINALFMIVLEPVKRGEMSPSRGKKNDNKKEEPAATTKNNNKTPVTAPAGKSTEATRSNAVNKPFPKTVTDSKQIK